MKCGDLIKELISQIGPMQVEQYLDLVIKHYYNAKDPLGKAGDFITAPEISQMFGEIIGIWCVDNWFKYGCPKFNLIEIGGGRGTLMHDFLRATKHITSFCGALNNIYMIEISDVLKKLQMHKLEHYNYNIKYLDDLTDFCSNRFNIVINNEFFDALPIKQYTKCKQGFKELFVDWTADKFQILAYGEKIKLNYQCEEGDIVEISPKRQQYAKKIINVLKLNGGFALIIDYGYLVPSMKSSIQAIKDNKYHHIFADIGEADVTSLVDFKSLMNIFLKDNLQVKLSSQRKFLIDNGIQVRAQQLIKLGANAEDIFISLNRLIGNKQMGNLFKVLEIYV